MTRTVDEEAWPKTGEIWRNARGVARYVRDVDEDGYIVVYSRSADNHRDWITVLMRDWLLWVNSTLATRMRKASTVKDWGYATDAR